MNNIKIFELDNNNWIEKSELSFGYVPVGKDFVSKTLCFSPINCDIADLKAKIEGKDDFVFVKSEDHLITEWKNISPFKIKEGERSNPVKIEFLVKSGPVRLDCLKIICEYLEVPSDFNESP